MAENLEMRNDPWGLLGTKFDSKCCVGKEAEVEMYDHTGATYVRCECGNQYWHNEGASTSFEGLGKFLLNNL